MSDKRRSIIIDAYRRIGKAAETGRGIRLSADECWEIWKYDNAISAAVTANEFQEDEDGA